MARGKRLNNFKPLVIMSYVAPQYNIATICCFVNQAVKQLLF